MKNYFFCFIILLHKKISLIFANCIFKNSSNFDTMRFVIFIFSLCLFLNCKVTREDQERVKNLARDMPEQVADSVDVTYSEEGIIKLKLKAPKLVMKNERAERYEEFPDGLVISFFKKNGEKNADLYADYGFSDQTKRERYVKNDVKIITTDSVTYTTDELYIDEKKDSVHNNGKYVKITKPDGTLLQGYGFTSNTRMEKIRINDIFNSELPVEEEDMNSEITQP